MLSKSVDSYLSYLVPNFNENIFNISLSCIMCDIVFFFNCVLTVLVSEWSPGPSKGTKLPEPWRQGLTPQNTDSFSTLPSLAEQLPRTKNASSDTWQTNAVLPHESIASLRCPPVFWGRSFETKPFYETGEIPRKNLDVMKEAMVQAEEVAAEITRKLEKYLPSGA